MTRTRHALLLLTTLATLTALGAAAVSLARPPLSPPPPPPPAPVPVHDLRTLPGATAERLAVPGGSPALYRVERDSLAERIDGRTAIDCTSADAVHRTAWLLLPEGAEVRDLITVRAAQRPAWPGWLMCWERS